MKNNNLQKETNKYSPELTPGELNLNWYSTFKTK